MAAVDIDEAVVRAACAGDGPALRTVYLALAPAVRGYLRAKGATDPDGLTGEVFLGVLPRLAGLRDGAVGLRKLVFSVAHARLVDDYRVRARQPEFVDYDVTLDHRVTASAEDVAVSRLAAGEVRAVLDRLPADQREVLLLRLVADLPIDAVAEIMGRSAGAVKQLQRRGLLTVRQELARAGVTR